MMIKEIKTEKPFKEILFNFPPRKLDCRFLLSGSKKKVIKDGIYN